MEPQITEEQKVAQEVAKNLRWSEIPEIERNAVVAFGWLQLWAMSDQKPDSLSEFLDVWNRSFADKLTSREAQAAHEAASACVKAVNEAKMPVGSVTNDFARGKSDGANIAKQQCVEAVRSAAQPYMKRD